MIFDRVTFGGPFRIAQLRYVNDDGGYHREARNPGADISDLPDEARAAINGEWTPEIIAAYRAATAPVPPTAEEIAEQTRAGAFSNAPSRREVLAALKSATPEQIEAYVRNRLNADAVTDLASARAFCKRTETAIASILHAIAPL